MRTRASSGVAWLLAPALALLLAAWGCGKGRAGAVSWGSSVVALVGDRPVEWQAVAAYVRQAAGDDANRVAPKVASSLLDQFLEEKLIERAVEEADPKAAGPTPADRRRDLIGRRARLSEIDEALLRKEWAARRTKDQGAPLVRVSQLMFTTREEAEEGRRRLERGQAWNEVSRALSVAPNSATGGSLGFLA